MRYRILLVSLLSTLLLLPPLAAAHHSDAGYDKTTTKTASGTLKEFDWNAPHAGVLVEYKNEKGETVEVYATTFAPQQLVRQGFAPKDFKAGQKVEVVWNPAHSGGAGGLLVSLTLEDGRVVRSGGPPGPPPPAPPTPKP
jgi:Family of unknown function (DUF6152)